MGAAYAQIAALDIKLRYNYDVRVRTFGGVRVGDGAFADCITKQFDGGASCRCQPRQRMQARLTQRALWDRRSCSDRFYRVVNYRDFAPHKPKRSDGYRHGGQEIWVNGGAPGAATTP